MTVLMDDAVASLSSPVRAAYDEGSLADLVYADDTLLMGVQVKHLTEFLRTVSDAGARYGMELHNEKYQMIQVQQGGCVNKPQGGKIDNSKSIQYLGVILAADGCTGSELSRRLGQAKSDFEVLHRVWNRSALTWRRKLHIFTALVESKLLYGLGSQCLTAAETRRLDGFQNRCVRKIIGIKPAYFSKVSNATVLQRAEHPAASSGLLQCQLRRLGKVLGCEDGEPRKDVSLVPGQLRSATDRYARRVGRPSKEWIPSVLGAAFAYCNGVTRLLEVAADEKAWMQEVVAKVRPSSLTQNAAYAPQGVR